ncbi:MAG: diadenylate cyclase CdaA [Oscillospiraceae bacterium]|nr:diadenylate cyclase CdaA [Oscillospiraceae bacterium]
MIMGTIRELYDTIFGLLMSLRQTVTLWDVLDVLIIALIIYQFLSFMRKTSSSSLMKGIVLVVAVAWLSNLLEMTVLSFLLSQVLQMGVIVLIILFQPEIRKIFERMGTSKINILFFKRGRYENVEAGIKSAVDASEAMAKSYTGAIIVFEREVGLNDYAVTGTSVDAAASSELIQNIFYHNAPLHDGALIIREGRLLAAACMLPLSNNINLSRDLGMRHRAGVGISERSDAVVVIASEQSGTVSVAIDGMLKRHLSKDTVEKLLMKELIHLADNKYSKRKEKNQKKEKENDDA